MLQTTKTRTQVLFYASHGIKVIVGEATIKNIELIKINQIYEKYRDKLFITKEEAKEYSKLFKSRRQPGVSKASEVKFPRSRNRKTSKVM